MNSLVFIKCIAGCYIDAQYMYVDGICLMALIAIAMQQLVVIFNNYGVVNDITSNLLKSVYLFF